MPVESEESVSLRQHDAHEDVQSEVVGQTISDGAQKLDFHHCVGITQEKGRNAGESVDFKNVYGLQVIFIFLIYLNPGFHGEQRHNCQTQQCQPICWGILRALNVRRDVVLSESDVETSRDVGLHDNTATEREKSPQRAVTSEKK